VVPCFVGLALGSASWRITPSASSPPPSALGVAILILRFAEDSDNFLNYLRGGLAAYAILGGLLVATTVEVVIGSFEDLQA
jgi:hypothetical protein